MLRGGSYGLDGAAKDNEYSKGLVALRDLAEYANKSYSYWAIDTRKNATGVALIKESSPENAVSSTDGASFTGGPNMTEGLRVVVVLDKSVNLEWNEEEKIFEIS